MSDLEGNRILIEHLQGRALRIAAAAETEPFAFAQSSTEELDIEEVLAQALAAANLCWENWEDAEAFSRDKFREHRASDIFGRLLGEVYRFMRIERELVADRAVAYIKSQSGVVRERDLSAFRAKILETP